MDANEQLLNTFSTRVRQMILHYQRVCEENAALKADVAEREGRIAELRFFSPTDTSITFIILRLATNKETPPTADKIIVTIFIS